jgi:hypothetical protein
MSGRLIEPQVIDHTGEVVGGFGVQPAECRLHGWAFANSAGAIGSVSFYIPAPAVNGRAPLLPSAAGTLLFTIDVPITNVSKEFALDAGIYFKDGLFVITSATTLTGCIFYS